VELVRKCSDGSEVWKKQGRKHSRDGSGNEHDFIIIYVSPKKDKWAISLDSLATLARCWGEVEDILYPRPRYKGRNKIVELLKYAIQKDYWTIEQCCYQTQIPGYADEFGLSIKSGEPRQARLTFKGIGCRIIVFVFLLFEAFK